MNFRNILSAATIVLVVLVTFILFTALSWEQKSTEEIQDATIVASEAQTVEAIKLLVHVSVIFDPPDTCWAVFSVWGRVDSGSISYIPCQVGRKRMAPSQLKALAEAEDKLGHPIP